MPNKPKIFTKRERMPCIQCGVCCIIVSCGLGEENKKTGLCEHLRFHDEGHTSCDLYERLKDKSNVFRSGCILRTLPEIYEEHVEMAESAIGRKIRGIKNG